MSYTSSVPALAQEIAYFMHGCTILKKTLLPLLLIHKRHEVETFMTDIGHDDK